MYRTRQIVNGECKSALRASKPVNSGLWDSLTPPPACRWQLNRKIIADIFR
jgi:hypothetical protein